MTLFLYSFTATAHNLERIFKTETETDLFIKTETDTFSVSEMSEISKTVLYEGRLSRGKFAVGDHVVVQDRRAVARQNVGLEGYVCKITKRTKTTWSQKYIDVYYQVQLEDGRCITHFSHCFRLV